MTGRRDAILAAREEYEAATERWNTAVVTGSPDRSWLARAMQEADIRLSDLESSNPEAAAEIEAQDEADYLGREADNSKEAGGREAGA